jgi:hypothetical protein
VDLYENENIIQGCMNSNDTCIILTNRRIFIISHSMEIIIISHDNEFTTVMFLGERLVCIDEYNNNFIVKYEERNRIIIETLGLFRGKLLIEYNK